MQALNTFQISTEVISSIGWSPDGATIRVTSQDNRVRVVNASNGSPRASYTFTQIAAISSTAFSPDGTRILFGDGTEIRDESALPTATPTSTPTATPTPTSTPTSTPTATPTPTSTPIPTAGLDITVSLGDPNIASGEDFNVVLIQNGVVIGEIAEIAANANSILNLPSMPYGTYSVWIKHPEYLAETIGSVVVDAAPNSATLSLLRAGDADNSNLVNITDFSILATSFGKMSTDVGFKENTDFNADNIVNITDFSLLATNFGQTGADDPAPNSSGARTSLPPQLANAALTITRPNNNPVSVNSTFTVTVRAGNAGSAANGITASRIDAAEVHLTFDSAKLRVESITRGSGLTTTLQETFDNTAGTLDVAYGRLSGTANNTFTVFTVTFRALASTGGTPTPIVTDPDAPTLLTYQGATSAVTGAPLTVTIP